MSKKQDWNFKNSTVKKGGIENWLWRKMSQSKKHQENLIKKKQMENKWWNLHWNFQAFPRMYRHLFWTLQGLPNNMHQLEHLIESFRTISRMQRS